LGENGVLSPEDDIALLDLHNHLRSTIATGETPFQPAAKNMKKLSWNTTLATQAKEWADQCKTGNDPNTTYGENVNLRGKAEDVLETRYRLEENVLYFYGEWFHYRLSTENETCYHQRGCGRYTQLAWANTESVGCGYAECPNNALGFGDDKPYQTVFVCRYFPAGNLVGQIPYIIAENDTGVASLCPSNEYAAIMLVDCASELNLLVSLLLSLVMSLHFLPAFKQVHSQTIIIRMEALYRTTIMILTSAFYQIFIPAFSQVIGRVLF